MRNGSQAGSFRDPQRFATIREAKDEVTAWLFWYKRRRPRSTLNYVSAVQFEQFWMDTTVRIAA